MKLMILLTAFFVWGCQSVITEIRNPANNSCQLSDEHEPLFNILQNTSKEITVELGDFAKKFDLDRDYKITVHFSGSKENKNEKEVLVLTTQADGPKTLIKVPVTKTGVYIFRIENIWRQKVFSIAPTEDTLDATTEEKLARQYAPFIEYHQDELYYPVSLEYLLNEVEPDPILAEEPFIVRAKKSKSTFGGLFSKASLNEEFKFKNIRQVLPYYGNADSVLKSGLSRLDQTRLKDRFGERHATLYYSVFENPKWKEIIINYHMFYTFDSKNGDNEDVALAAHIFDRESITVVLRSTTLKPLYVFYGAHLASQTMAYLDAQDRVAQSWQTGRVFVNWPDAIKVNDRPLAYAALGSHGMYPIQGNYAVMIGNIKALREPAGGGRVLAPDFENSRMENRQLVKYKLRPLKLNEVTSSCSNANNILSFSGSTVDVLGSVNATFPPFTDREEDYFSYSDPNAPLFEMPKRK